MVPYSSKNTLTLMSLMCSITVLENQLTCTMSEGRMVS